MPTNYWFLENFAKGKQLDQGKPGANKSYDTQSSPFDECDSTCTCQHMCH